jgi:hypothetical protein
VNRDKIHAESAHPGFLEVPLNNSSLDFHEAYVNGQYESDRCKKLNLENGKRKGRE